MGLDGRLGGGVAHPDRPHQVTDEPDQDLLIRVAKRLAPLDAQLARDVYLEALGTAVCAGPSGNIRAVVAVARAAHDAPPAPHPPRAVDRLLDGLITRFTIGYAASVPELRRALRAFGPSDSSGISERWQWLFARTAADLWEDDLPVKGWGWSALTLADERRSGIIPVAGLGSDPVEPTGAESSPAFMNAYSRAARANGLGRYGEALEASKRACARDELGLFGPALTELVESAVRTFETQVAADALARLSERAQASGTEWALGIEARSRALVSRGTAAEGLYREAIDRLGGTRIGVELARSHLLYGEWLRRENRRVDARDQLRRAFELFDTSGAREFAERTSRELLATGETVRKRTVERARDLTSQEEVIAGLAGERLTNSEIATQLFISPRTVEWHLRKVFTKLGVSSRRELRISLSERTLEAVGI